MTPLLHDYAARSAERHGRAPAVVLADEQVSYAELVSESRRIARLFNQLGVGRGDRVAMVSAKTPMAIVGLHAALEAGAAYVPIDPASPAARAAMILEDAEPAAVIASGQAGRLLDELARRGSLPPEGVIALDEPGDANGAGRFQHGPPDWAAHSDQPLQPQLRGSDLAHILFTSGSTGTPKGVRITHAMVGAFVDWAIAHFGTAPGERISGHPPLHFDLSTFDIYATLGAGAELHLVPPMANLKPQALAEFIRTTRLDQWFSVPSTLAFMTAGEAVEQDDFPTLKRVLFCGEAMPTPVLAEWMRLVPHPTYTNLYGPTETTIASSYHELEEAPRDESEPVPIGIPIPGEQLHVLDERLAPVEAGEIGEIYISGVGLSPGYWRSPEKTEAAFLERPADGARLYRTGDLGWIDGRGRFMYSGRVDSQIKHRGYRIELGEIEAALSASGLTAEVAVVATPSPGFEGTRICAAFVPREEDTEPPELRAALRERLPGYMVPTAWERFDALPKNSSGKIDRRALREGFGERSSAD